MSPSERRKRLDAKDAAKLSEIDGLIAELKALHTTATETRENLAAGIENFGWAAVLKKRLEGVTDGWQRSIDKIRAYDSAGPIEAGKHDAARSRSMRHFRGGK